jgi:cellulose synthase operon protein YhjU
MKHTQSIRQSTIDGFRGLGAWNYYFLLKFALLWYGYLHFHPFYNLIFLAFLLFPIRSLFVNRMRHWIALPIGFGLFYHDTWLPGFATIMSQGSSVFDFSFAYIMELLHRFINWKMVGMAFILFVAYLYVATWIRLTVVTVGVLCWLNIVAWQGATALISVPNNAASPPKNTAKSSEPIDKNLPPSNENLNAYLAAFYAEQAKLHTNFPHELAQDAVPFSILFVQICSLAWSDIDAVHLQNHPIWSQFDIMFSHFNSAASYSGPAAIRLLRASCGQTTHQDLYHPANEDCYIMNNLKKLGFTSELMLDHTGVFGDFLGEIRTNGGMQNTPLMSQAGISTALISFDNSPIYNNLELLDRWLKNNNQALGKRSNATFFNVITLHDGNHTVDANTPVPYGAVATGLLDNLNTFFAQLNASGAKAVVIFIPEHGRNLVGDKFEVPGLRDIPSPNVTHVPVGIKFFGMKAARQKEPLQLDAPSSYLAISELINRLVNGALFKQESLDLHALTDKLPKTKAVSANEGVTVMDYQGKSYILLKGESSWVPYN